jgi:hypothetical protein
VLSLQGLIQMQSSAVELADLMKLICKTFWSSTYLDIPTLLMNREVFVAWMTCFDALLRLPVPEVGRTHIEKTTRLDWLSAHLYPSYPVTTFRTVRCFGNIYPKLERVRISRDMCGF